MIESGPAGVSPTSPRPVRNAGFVVTTVDELGVRFLKDERVPVVDPLLSSAQAAELLGIQPSSWRNLVHRRVAPAADDPDAGRPANRREPRWLLSTVLDYKVRRRPRGGQLGVKRGPHDE